VSAGTAGVWTLRIVRPDGLGPAAGIPVTLLDERDDAAGYWVSDRDGLVALPATAAARVRLRIGLRNETPVELDAAALAAGPSPRDLPAPRDFPLTLASRTEPAALARPAAEPAEAVAEPLGQVLHFARLLMLAPPSGEDAAHPALPTAAADFFEPATHFPTAIRYGALVEVEQYWHPLGYASGELLYTVALPPGDETRVAVLDERWGDRGGRPLQTMARLIGSSTMADLVSAGEEAGAAPLEPLTLFADGAAAGDALARGVAETTQLLNARATRAAETLRRAPLRVTEGGGDSAAAAIRVLRNPGSDRLLLYHFYEPLQRYRVSARAARLRPAVLIPFRPPNLAVRGMVRQFGALIRRALLDRTLLPELDALLGLDARQSGEWERAGAGPPVSELRVIVEPGPGAPAPELGQLWCYLRADQTRYTVHFFPATAAPVALPPSQQGAAHWIGAIRLADFHERPLRYPGELTLENGSRTSLVFKTLHLEGRIGDAWRRLLTVGDLAFPAQSQVQLASLAALVGAAGLAGRESRLLGHVAAHLPYYAAAIIAGGDPGVRYLALARMRDGRGRVIADLIENTVAGVVGNYLAFPLLAAEYVPEELRRAFTEAGARPPRTPEEAVVTFPLPGVWLSAQAGPAILAPSDEASDDQARPTTERLRGGRRFPA
jgi:hypothetical protein